MSEKQWRPFEDECLNCGAGAEVLTISAEDNLAYDGEQARCSECGCPGTMRADECEEGWIDWHDEPDCDCDWCKAHPA